MQAVDAGVNFDDQEALTLDHYGEILAILTLAFIPVTIFFVYHGIKETRQLRREEVGDNETGIIFENEGGPQFELEIENPVWPNRKEEEL